ncbi:hypothetical protein [Paenibacillus radicis (ex Gao et al. 2016)]|uniref:Uncharacterized protein n=1 Tax=Paenibacillus radicis (ex Gao et al. 2016) TaxID=1737354 RepID=A0A917H032_9BACL|nr:hypothetical protein [Paenibacillus radicis (ex Gao et al. 2016)]GGG62512.1 hypothetical protein GCM10010918_15300 [Paenibacillus radicis (ex Gao et al. 2016)]
MWCCVGKVIIVKNQGVINFGRAVQVETDTVESDEADPEGEGAPVVRARGPSKRPAKAKAFGKQKLKKR